VHNPLRLGTEKRFLILVDKILDILLTVTSASTSSHILGLAKFFKVAETALMAAEEMLSSYGYYKWIAFSQET